MRQDAGGIGTEVAPCGDDRPCTTGRGGCRRPAGRRVRARSRWCPKRSTPTRSWSTRPTSKQRRRRRKLRSIVFRAVLIVGALVISGWILLSTFEDLDFDAIVDSITSLEDADAIALLAMWVIWIAAQGLLTASLVPGLPVRRGVVAYLGPAGVTAIIPGPSDLPFRLKMFIAWGYSPTDATLAVAAGSVFSIGIKLVLPVVAAIGLLVSGTPIEGTLRTVVVVAVLVGVGVFADRRHRRLGEAHRPDRPHHRAGARLRAPPPAQARPARSRRDVDRCPRRIDRPSP